MINRLRKKFIAITMISVFIVLTVIVSAINIMNYRNVVSDADSAIRMIEQNGGKLPGRPEKGEESEKPEKGGAPSGGPTRDHFDMSIKEHRRAEMPFDTRYFTVTITEDGSIKESNTDSIAMMSEQDAEDFAKTIYDEGEDKGFKGNYRFKSINTKEGKLVIVVDCYRGLGNFRSFLIYSLLVAALGFSAVFVLVLILSKRAVKPVAESYEKQKEFITSAGHELKTPLTVIDADAEVIEMESGKSEWLDDIRDQTGKLADLTNELIYLSKMDEDRGINKLEFPISDVIEDVTGSFASRIKTDNKEFDADIEKGLSYNGDEKLIRELVSVLMDNAIKYSDENGSISLKLRSAAQGVDIICVNSVKDPDSIDTKHMFDRFYRADQSRNKDIAGYGLGLSIAASVCEAHSGSISATMDGNSGIIITAKLR